MVTHRNVLFTISCDTATKNYRILNKNNSLVCKIEAKIVLILMCFLGFVELFNFNISSLRH